MKKAIPVAMLIGLSLLGGYSCTTADEELVGTWEIARLRITLNSYNGTPGRKVVEASAKDWEEKMHSRNIRTTFSADHTYHSLHRDLKDSVTYDPAGRWLIEGDSLVITDTFPKPAVYRYRVKVKGGVAEFDGVEDFDGDGKRDDGYYSRQSRVSGIAE